MNILFQSINGRVRATAYVHKSTMAHAITELETHFPTAHWRVHDGTGWCDESSPAARVVIMTTTAQSFDMVTNKV